MFARMHAMYGKHWLDLWESAPMADVKAAWASDLAGFKAGQIKAALDHCRANCKFPPTLPEFVGYCRQFRQEPANAIYLPAPRGELPANVAAVLQAFKPTPGKDFRKWARDILEKHANGIVFPAISLEFAKEALSAEQ